MRHVLFPSLLFVPIVVSAQTGPTFADFVALITDLIQLLVAGIFALTFLVLVWTVVKVWIFSGGDQTEIEKGKYVITVGVVVLVIMSGIWGILELLRGGLFGF